MRRLLPERARAKTRRTTFADRLRRRIVGLLHAGRLKPDDRLPSIRSLASEFGVDHRVVAAAYRAMQRHGLISIQPSSGVFVASESRSAATAQDGAAWLVDALADGWQRGISPLSVVDRIARIRAAPLRCACVESNEDHLVAMAAELAADFPLHPVPVLVGPTPSAHPLPADLLADVDLVVTSVFHAHELRALSALEGKEVVVASMNPAFTEAIEARLRAGTVTTVYLDEGYASRGRTFFADTRYADRVDFVHVDRFRGPPGDDVLVTRAARRTLGLPDFHLIPDVPTIGAEAARVLCEAIVSASARGA